MTTPRPQREISRDLGLDLRISRDLRILLPTLVLPGALQHEHLVHAPRRFRLVRVKVRVRVRIRFRVRVRIRARARARARVRVRVRVGVRVRVRVRVGVRVRTTMAE